MTESLTESHQVQRDTEALRRRHTGTNTTVPFSLSPPPSLVCGFCWGHHHHHHHHHHHRGWSFIVPGCISAAMAIVTFLGLVECAPWRRGRGGGEEEGRGRGKGGREEGMFCLCLRTRPDACYCLAMSTNSTVFTPHTSSPSPHPPPMLQSPRIWSSRHRTRSKT